MTAQGVIVHPLVGLWRHSLHSVHHLVKEVDQHTQAAVLALSDGPNLVQPVPAHLHGDVGHPPLGDILIDPVSLPAVGVFVGPMQGLGKGGRRPASKESLPGDRGDGGCYGVCAVLVESQIRQNRPKIVAQQEPLVQRQPVEAEQGQALVPICLLVEPAVDGHQTDGAFVVLVIVHGAVAGLDKGPKVVIEGLSRSGQVGLDLIIGRGGQAVSLVDHFSPLVGQVEPVAQVGLAAGEGGVVHRLEAGQPGLEVVEGLDDALLFLNVLSPNTYLLR